MKPARSHQFRGLLRNLKRFRPHLFFPATAIFTGILKKNPRSNLMSSSVTSTLQLGFLAPPKVKLQTMMRLMAAVANMTLDRWVMNIFHRKIIINEFLQMKKTWSWRCVLLDLDDDFFRIDLKDCNQCLVSEPSEKKSAFGVNFFLGWIFLMFLCLVGDWVVYT